MELEKATIIITGGASGLGAAAARSLRDAGAHPVIFDRDVQHGLQTARDLDADFFEVDVADAASVEQAVLAVQNKTGAIHGLVQCAGVGYAKKLLGRDAPHSLEDFMEVIRVNLAGTFNVARLVAMHMSCNDPQVDGERGVIINTTSVAAFEGQVGQVAYAASKGGVAAMTLPLARELAPYGIRVAAIAPGIFETPMLGVLSGTARQSLADQIPFPRRLGMPAEYGTLVRHIMENRMINGEIIRLDGGLRMGAR